MHCQLREKSVRSSGLLVAVLLALSGPAVAEELTEVLRRVEAYAPALQAATADARAGEEAVRQARGRFFGELTAFVRDSHFNDPRLTEVLSPPLDIGALPFDDDQIGYGVNGRLPLDVNGRLGAGLRAARADAASARADAADVRLRLLHDTARLYRGLQQLAGQRDALERQLEALEAHLRVAETAVRIGRIARVELLRLAAEREGVRGNLAVLDGLAAGLRARLSALMGVERFTDNVDVATGFPEGPRAAGSLAARPDVIASGERANAAEAGIRSARAERLPELTIEGTWERNQGYSGVGGDATWQVLLTARVSLWDGSVRRRGVWRARARHEAAEQRLNAQRDAARADLAAAKASWNAARVRLEATVAAVEAADETARIQADRFAAGRLSAADLVDADAALASARADLAQARTDWWQADDAWRLALGEPPGAYEPAGTTAISEGETP